MIQCYNSLKHNILGLKQKHVRKVFKEKGILSFQRTEKS